MNVSPFYENNLANPQWTLEEKVEDMKQAVEEVLQEMHDLEKELQACLDITSDNMKA
jgi:hypothetical protein